MKIIDKPKHLAPDNYAKCLKTVVARLQNSPEILSVYQIGGITTPGISDIDLVIICKDHAQIKSSFLNFQDASERYAFVHGIYGISSTLFDKAKDYTLYHNYPHLYGQVRSFENKLMPEEKKNLERQVALEFLAKMYVNLAVQSRYNTIKLRSFFLHIKGIMYDLAFLGKEKTPLADYTKELVEIREKWFTKRVSDPVLSDVFKKYTKLFSEAFAGILESETLYLPAAQNISLSKNIDLTCSQSLGVTFRGIRLPSLFAGSNFFFKINNRFSHFTIQLPFKNIDDVELLQKRYVLFKSLEDYRKEYIPYTLSLTSSLNYF